MGEVELLFVKENNKLRAKEPEINLEGRDGDRVKLNERQPMISTTSTAKNTFYLQTKQEQNCQREKINNSINFLATYPQIKHCCKTRITLK